LNYKLDHIALNCKDLAESVRYYENHFSDQSTPIRKAGDGQNFYISGAAAIQLIESASETGINHYGFVTNDVEQVAKDLREKTPRSFAKSATPTAS
jgi:Glyoxalase/Bleomycin resistance protein/Dioxygenase superfamily